MPRKHVHFAPTISHVANDEEPSPSFSVSTLPSSPGVLTPPPLGSGSPYESKQLPLIEADIHPWLSMSNGANFNIDLAYPISQTPGTYNYVAPDVLRHPATVPPVSSMSITIACSRQPLPTPLTVDVQSGSATFPFVTIHDVFMTIYAHLRKPVSGHDFARALPTQMAQDAVSIAFRARCERAGPGYSAEKAKGLKRVDFLMGRTRFRGIVPMQMGLQGWVLEVS